MNLVEIHARNRLKAVFPNLQVDKHRQQCLKSFKNRKKIISACDISHIPPSNKLRLRHFVFKEQFSFFIFSNFLFNLCYEHLTTIDYSFFCFLGRGGFQETGVVSVMETICSPPI
jgi:hypothetical protein